MKGVARAFIIIILIFFQQAAMAVTAAELRFMATCKSLGLRHCRAAELCGDAGHVFKNLIYDQAYQEWKTDKKVTTPISVAAAIVVISVALPFMRLGGELEDKFWQDIGDMLDDFYKEHALPWTNRTVVRINLSLIQSLIFDFISNWLKQEFIIATKIELRGKGGAFMNTEPDKKRFLDSIDANEFIKGEEREKRAKEDRVTEDCDIDDVIVEFKKSFSFSTLPAAIVFPDGCSSNVGARAAARSV